MTKKKKKKKYDSYDKAAFGLIYKIQLDFGFFLKE
jgi:hypothetical protein